MNQPMLEGHSPHASKPFGERPIWQRQADGTVRWLTPRQMGLDEATIAAVEAAEAKGDAAPRPTPAPQPAPVQPEAIPFPEPARLVFGRISKADGLKLARQAEQAIETRQEALL